LEYDQLLLAKIHGIVFNIAKILLKVEVVKGHLHQ
jgi:hypothetical protein